MEESLSGLLWGENAALLLGLASGPWVVACWWFFSHASFFLFAAFFVCLFFSSLFLLLLLPLPPRWRPTYKPAVIGMGALKPQPPNLALLLSEEPLDRSSNCSSCSAKGNKSWAYLMRLSGLVRPLHAQHRKEIVITADGDRQADNVIATSSNSSSSKLPKMVPLHSVVERFAGWGGETPVATPRFTEHPAAAADMHRPLPQQEQEQQQQQHQQQEWTVLPAAAAAAAGTDAGSFWGAHYLPAAATAAAGKPAVQTAEGGRQQQQLEQQCKCCRLASSWLQPVAVSRQQLLKACPSLSEGFRPDSLLLQHRLTQGLLLHVQEQLRPISLIAFDRQYWVTSVDGDVILLHYYRHRTDANACSASWGPQDEAAAQEGVGCTDSRFPCGRPHGLCGCRGILFIVGGIGAKAHDLQVQHVVQLASLKGFCVFFLSCLRGIDAPISNLPTDLTTSADVQASLCFILHLHVNGFERQHQKQQQQQQQQKHEQQQQQQDEEAGRSVLKMHEVDNAFRRIIIEGSEEAFLRSIPSGFIPPVFLMGYSMGSCAVLRLLGSLGLQQAVQQLQLQQLQQQQATEGKEPPSSPREEAATEKTPQGHANSSSSSSSSRSEPTLSPFCRDLAAAVASEYIPSLEWLRFLKGAVAISNAMCLDSCIGSLDRASGVTGRLCKLTMLKMYKAKQWLEPSRNYVSKGLDPGLVALSQMTSSLREIDLLTHLSLCLTPSSPLACTRVYYALTTCLPHMLLAPVPLLCLHALDDPIVEPLSVCRAAATVPKYNSNCTYAIVERGGHNLFQESFWRLLGSQLWQRMQNSVSRKTGKWKANAEEEKQLHVHHSFQARAAFEFISAVWRRCESEAADRKQQAAVSSA
ncbi:hypothetical protein Efla_004683 [Eimeria flavescens]